MNVVLYCRRFWIASEREFPARNGGNLFCAVKVKKGHGRQNRAQGDR